MAYDDDWRRGALFTLLLVMAFGRVGEGQDLVPAIRDGRYGYMDSKQTFRIEPRFKDAGPFSNGLAPALQDEHWGYIDAQGEFVIPPRYEAADVFTRVTAGPPGNRLRAPVALQGKYGFIDSAGKTVIPPQFDWAGPFRSDRALIRLGEKFGYIDPTGKQVIEAGFAKARRFVNGFAAVAPMGERFGLIDRTGRFVVETRFAAIGDVHFDRASFRNDQGRYGFLDSKGRQVIEAQYLSALDFTAGGVALVQTTDRKWLAINQEGRRLLDKSFDNASRYPGSPIRPGQLVAWEGNAAVELKMAGANLKWWPFNFSPDMLPVVMRSSPGAEIHCVQMWEYTTAERAGNIDSLLDANHLLSLETIEHTELLNKYVRYMLLFTRNSVTKRLPCQPDRHPRREVAFP